MAACYLLCPTDYGDTHDGYTHYDYTHHKVRRYHHCVACGEDEGFDLCTSCYRAGACAS